MRKWWPALCALAVAGSASALAANPGVTTTAPKSPPPANDPGLLFWDVETRSDRFRHLEDFYVGLETGAAAKVRELPAGEPFDAATASEIARHLETINAAGIIVLQDGKIRHQAYRLGFTPDQRWTSFSVAKSFTSTLLGAAVRDGKLSLADQVTRFLPKLKGTVYDGVQVGHVATMTSGINWNEDYADPKSNVAQMLNVARVEGESQSVTYARGLTRGAEPGTRWVYNTLETNLLGDIVSSAVGMPLAAYAKQKIVEPAGFAGSLFWMTDRGTDNIGGCCLSLTLGDYARMGQWVLEGAQPSVPEGWFEKAGARAIEVSPTLGYGYQWWVYPDGFGAQGIFGQFITLLPKQRVVIAVVSNHPVATGRTLSEARAALSRTVAKAVQ